jgi:hypothetical protein
VAVTTTTSRSTCHDRAPRAVLKVDAGREQVGGAPRTRVESHEVRQGNYHDFQPGSLLATCDKTPAYRDVEAKFMNHHRLQMDSFRCVRTRPLHLWPSSIAMPWPSPP